MTMKRFFKQFPKYAIAVWADRAFLVSFKFMVVGCLGWSAAEILRITLLKFVGPDTLAYTKEIVSVGSLAFAGGVIATFITHFIAYHRYNKAQDEEERRRREAEENPTPAVAVAPIAPAPPNVEPLAFDANKGILSYHGKQCKIPEKTYQHLVCTKLFEKPGRHVEEWEILFAVDYERDKADSERLVKDAVYAVSAKAKAAFGIEKALVWESLTAWVNDIYLA